MRIPHRPYHRLGRAIQIRREFLAILATTSLVVADLLFVSGILPAGVPTNDNIQADAQARFDSWQAVAPNGKISASGNYFLDRDLAVNRDTGVTITADNVVLDLRGHVLSFSDKPRKGTFGVVAQHRKNVTVRNGCIRGFWFNIHTTDCQSLSIVRVKFDDIPYLAVNSARGRQVAIRQCVFEGFRYDIPKPKDKYLVGINLGGEDVLIAQNEFSAVVPEGNVNLETVFVLLSANVTRRCIVGLNQMKATRFLPRSYGVWVATGSRATLADNEMRNLNYAVALAKNAEAVVSHNRIEVETDDGGDSYGIYATRAKSITAVENTYRGLNDEQLLPK